MPAAKKDFYIEQGSTFEVGLIWQTPGSPPTPKNITGYMARMQVRTAIGAPGDPLLDLSTDPSKGITITGAAGRIDITITAAQTDALTVKKAVYDLELVSGTGKVTRLLQGGITIDPAVTRTPQEA